MKTPTQNTTQPLSSVYKRGAADSSEFDLQNQSINQHHKRQRTDSHENLSHDFVFNDSIRRPFSLSRRKRSRSQRDEEDGSNDSAIGKGNAFGSSRDDHQQAPYSAGGMFYPSPSITPSFSINSNTPPLLARFAPTVTAPPYIHQRPQILPSFSVAFGMPSISSVSLPSPHVLPAVTAGRAASRSEAQVNLNPEFDTDDVCSPESMIWYMYHPS